MHQRPPDLGTEMEVRIRTAARALRDARRTTALTGAGLSVESGIPPFRGGAGGPPGLWERYDPMEYATIEAFERDPGHVWLMLRELARALMGARPNAAHLALARLQSAGLLDAIVTQNIDGLHQEAGCRRVLEFHGNWRTMTCRRCRSRIESREVPLETLPPRCRCGGPLKPDVTLFGEIIPAELIDAAREEVRACDCLLVIGASAEVFPAAALPGLAREGGAFVIEVNLEETALTGRVADLSLRGPVGIVLPRLAEEAGARLEH